MTAAEPLALEGLHEPQALPTITSTTAPYFAAAARGELWFQRCGAGHAFLYPRLLCPTCHSEDLDWEQASGGGEVVTFAPVHRPPWNELPRTTPYTIVLVRLIEGPQLLSTLERIDPGAVTVGLSVQAAFERVRDDLGLVRFVPAHNADTR